MPIHAYLESPTIYNDYREFKIVMPVSSNPTTLLLYRFRNLPLFTGLPICQRVTFKFAGLVYRSHETSPTDLSSLLHAYTPT